MLATRILRPAIARQTILSSSRRATSIVKSASSLRKCINSITFASDVRAFHHRNVAQAQAQAQAQAAPIDAAQVQCIVVSSGIEPKVQIQWDDGQISTFDNQFLLDHCRCPSCFHDKTKQRLKTLLQVPTNVAASKASIQGENLVVEWQTTPTHESTFPLNFLHQSSYDPPLATRAELLNQTPLSVWGSSIAQNPPTVEYESVMPALAGSKADQGVLRWLDKIHEFGFCFVTGVPTTTEATEELIRRMAHIRETHYGGFWDFTADMSKGDLAYSNQALPAHTDTAYFTDPAGLQIFHCLHHPSPPGTGGETLLVDAFYVAAEMAKRDPEAYATLSRLAVPFHASGNDNTVLRPPVSQPVFRHDHLGRLQQARWNNEDRCVLGEGWTPSEVREWYRAARVFEDICTSNEAEYWVKLNPGTVVVIDNWRVMHGRAAFTGERRMCGAYVGADDWRSRRHALRALEKPDNVWNAGW